jgi:hypothetical protein
VKQLRLRWLVAVMGVLAILRVLMPTQIRNEPPGVAEAIVRKPLADAIARASRSEVPALFIVQRTIEVDVPGDAFAVRPPPPPPYTPPLIVSKSRAALPLPSPPVQPPLAVVVATQPPLPPVPYQVIGTWDDGPASGVFLSSPYGTLLARPGDTLQSEYRVTAVTSQQITLMQLATQREVRLVVPRPPNTPRSYP